MTPEEVLELVAALDGPDAEAARTRLGEELRSLHPRVVRLCRKYVSNPEMAEELAQDAMATAFAQLPNYRGDSTLKAWVTGIARNHSRNAVRKRAETLSADGVLDPHGEEQPVVNALQWAEREQVIREAAAAALTPLEQEVVHLRYVEQLSQEAITEMLGLEGATGARGVLQRCRRKLARAIRARLVELGHGSSFVRKLPTEWE